jgi:hypothetical protein
MKLSEWEYCNTAFLRKTDIGSPPFPVAKNIKTLLSYSFSLSNGTGVIRCK